MSGLRTARREMIEAGGRTAQSFGVNRLMGQVYVLLYLSPEPLCLDQIAEGLGVSKASVSIICRQLGGFGAIKRVWVKGDRKDYYRAVTDVGSLINGGILDVLAKKLDSARVQIERSLELLEADGASTAETEHVRHRLREAERYRSKMANLMRNPLVKAMF